MLSQGLVKKAKPAARAAQSRAHARVLRVAHVNLHIDYLPGLARTRADEARAAATLAGVDWQVWVMSPDPRYNIAPVHWVPLAMVTGLHNNIEHTDRDSFYRARALTGNFLWQRVRFNLLVNRLSRRFDVVVVRYNSADLLAWGVLRRKHKLVFYPHNKPMQELMVYSKLGALVERLTGPLQYAGALAIAAESPEIAAHEAARCPGECPIIDFPNGVFVDEAHPPADDRGGCLKLAMVCSEFQVWQGLDLVLDRLEQYRGEQDYELHLVGRLNDAMQRRVRRLPQVTAHGYLQQRELRDLLARMDLGVSSMGVFRKNIRQLNALKTRAYLAAGLPAFQSYEDPAFPPGFPWVHTVHAQRWTWQQALNAAAAAREVSRHEVRAAALPFIDFRYILRSVTAQIENLRAAPRHVVMVLEHDFLLPVVDRRVEKEALRLLQEGYRVTILCWALHLSSELPRRLEHRGISVLRMFATAPPVGAPGWRKLPAFAALQAQTIIALRRLRPDVVHCHDAMPLAASTLGARLTRAHLVYDSHEVNAHRDEPALEMRVYGLMERLCLPHCDKVFTANEPRRQYLAAQYPHAAMHITALHNVPPLGGEETQHEASEAIRLLYQGVVSEARGVDNLLRALAMVQGPLHLTLVGPARPDEERFRRLITELGLEHRVTMHPILPISDVFELMRHADVGVVAVRGTSVNNRLCAPNKLYDYMRAGLAVLGPGFPHMRREIEDTGLGLCASFDDAAQLADALREMLARRDALPAMRRAAWLRHRQLRNWEQESERLANAYRGLR